ncbi:serine carboxypeptidase-like 7 isoform X2 [Phragmites australis]|uniref:serine carboxypeptidase-like 7 isoform X2 n=1 Tax=Phragmites australis TaxID=29695 RepID=UPI002D7994F8|nr:serine carboxypeptidase-like 7 isoform X2 [Phragmites australis]XP_062212299.1 serine carboxypeptidase-like 7 isoform X2 [Phragmites australis]
MAFKLLWIHAGHCHLPLPLHLIVACLLLLLLLLPLPLSRSASSTVVTHLPGFDGPLPFYMETGYVGVEEETGTELFYYFVESERSPRTDAVILWLSGGPRCSAFNGLVYEIGPVQFVVKPYDGTLPQLVCSPNSWTQMASILFVDSPVGSGFSYAPDPKGYDIGDISSSMQVVTFLRKWFDDHPRYLLNPFYIGGDSYAGKVVPLIAQYISEGTEGMQHPLINLKGYLVGNPLTGDKIDDNSRIPYAHSFGIISNQLYEAAVKNCKGDYASPTNKLCADVVRTINNLTSEVSSSNILGAICPGDDIRRKSRPEEHYWLGDPPEEPPFSCFTYRLYLSYFWANNNATQAALGIKEGTVTEWIRCKRYADLPYAFDLPSSIKYHFNLTSRGYRALVYSGDHDLIIPFSGTHAWIRSFNLSIVDDWRAWHLDGQAAGLSRLLFF